MNDYERLGKILWGLATVAVLAALCQLIGIARGPAVLVGMDTPQLRAPHPPKHPTPKEPLFRR